MGAYIINVPDTVDTIIYVNIGDVYDGKTYIASQRVEDLTPYTELDLEQVRKEAYERGAEDMRKALRLLIDCDDDCLTIPDIFKAFREGSYHAVVRKHPAMEIIEKIRQYEQKKEEIIDPDKNKVEALANDIGIHKLYALVKEIRGE